MNATTLGKIWLAGMRFARFARIMQGNTNTHVVNIAIIGPPAVGKSDQTYVKCISVEGRSVLLHIIDSCNDSALRKMGPGLERLIKRSHGILVVFSLTDLTSFYVASAVLQKLVQRQETPPFILVANKADLFHMRCFNYQWGMETATASGCPYLEVSAAEGLKEVDIAFSSIARLALVSKSRKLCSNPVCIFLLWWRKQRQQKKGTQGNRHKSH